jgi:Rod binding domain-containing protein
MMNGLSVIRAVETMQVAGPELQKLKKATDGLEGFMFKSLLHAVGGKDGLFGNKVPGAQIYNDMFEQNFSDLLAERGAIGIGKKIYSNVAPLVIQQARHQILTKKPSIETKA